MTVTNRSENFILFWCQEDILNDSPDHRTEVYAFIHDWKVTKGKEINNNFSHDNWTGVYCWVEKFEPRLMKTLPLFGHHSLRPDNFIFYFKAHHPYLSILIDLYLFTKIRVPVIHLTVSLTMIIGMLRVWRKGKQGELYIDTDGKMLSFFKVQCFKLKITGFILDFIIRNHKALKTWRTIFSIYHETDRPHIFAAYINWKLRNL
jgi:hypothetical protein